MKEHALVFYERLIKFELKEKEKVKTEPDRSYYFKTIDAISAERQRTLDNLSTMSSVSSEEKTERRVRSYQQKLVMMIEEVSDRLGKEGLEDKSEISENNTWLNIYRQLYTDLSEILWTVENEFTQYLDIHLRIPVLYLINARINIAAEVPALINSFAERGICDKLLVLMAEPFSELLNYENGPRITYHKLFYMKILMQELAQITTLKLDSIDEAVWWKLMELNYNSDEFLAYCTSRIKEDMEDLPLRDVLERLLFRQKEVAQLRHKPGVAYNPSSTALNICLREWTAAEVQYFKERDQLSYNRADLPEELLRWKDFKIHTKFSVPQIGYLLRLLMDSEQYTNQNKSEVLEFFATFFTSQRQTAISVISLRKNFYNENASVSEAVRGILANLMNQSRKN
ncbi:hypothetical protein [uncultured Chitinophaga sp.]|uniref:hypothetical protein n=1 Tax=uncultured Chitinophaga sp. TaxID=339340 RepID=UPI0025E63B65|nr:hypothetical protein [uncultured Chitinophaga sp.]